MEIKIIQEAKIHFDNTNLIRLVNICEKILEDSHVLNSFNNDEIDFIKFLFNTLDDKRRTRK